MQRRLSSYSVVAVIVVALSVAFATIMHHLSMKFNGLACSNGQVDASAAEADMFAAIDSKFDFINHYTRRRYPQYQRGFWGIANKDVSSPHYYGTAKTKFMYDHLRRMKNVSTMCEVGFNAGHSAVLMLDSVPKAKLLEFDLGSLNCDCNPNIWFGTVQYMHWHRTNASQPYRRAVTSPSGSSFAYHGSTFFALKNNDFCAGDVAWAKENAALLEYAYGDRFLYIEGDSRKTIPKFAEENPSLVCDVIFVDGAKGEQARFDDVVNLMKISRTDTFVFGDEGNTVECMSGLVEREDPACLESSFHNTSLAWHTLVRHDMLNFVDCSKPVKLNDIVCLWRFSKNAYDISDL
jgi:hypothetical protein